MESDLKIDADLIDEPCDAPEAIGNLESLDLKVPNMDHFENVSDYFRAFYDLNRHQTAFSCRKFSKAIGWPHSFLNDLIANRKNLTVARALEFSRLLKLTVPETERLITMSFQSSESVTSSHFFREQFEQAHDLDSRHNIQAISPKFHQTQIPVVENSELTPAFFLVAGVISWLQRPVVMTELWQICRQLPLELTFEGLKQSISELEKLGMIQVENETISNYRPAYFVGPASTLSSSAKIMASLLERQAKDRLPQNVSRRLYRNGLVEFPKEKMVELQQRVGSLANWIGNVSRDCLKNPNYKPSENPLIKYDLFYSRLIDDDSVLEKTQIQSQNEFPKAGA